MTKIEFIEMQIEAAKANIAGFAAAYEEIPAKGVRAELVYWQEQLEVAKQEAGVPA